MKICNEFNETLKKKKNLMFVHKEANVFFKEDMISK